MFYLVIPGEREILNNWRPITLLNVDYTIIERVLAARFKKILPYIVDEDQKGYVDKRNISIKLNEDVIFNCDKSGKQGIILYVDQSKAFDRVEWKWMILVLEKLHFGQKFSLKSHIKKQKVTSLQMALCQKWLVYHAVSDRVHYCIFIHNPRRTTC